MVQCLNIPIWILAGVLTDGSSSMPDGVLTDGSSSMPDGVLTDGSSNMPERNSGVSLLVASYVKNKMGQI
jgi:hypothetical protein